MNKWPRRLLGLILVSPVPIFGLWAVVEAVGWNGLLAMVSVVLVGGVLLVMLVAGCVLLDE